MPATRQLPLTIEQREALLTLRSRGPGALLDEAAMYGLASAGLIEVNSERRVVLTARGEAVHMDDSPITDRVLGVLPDKPRRD